MKNQLMKEAEALKEDLMTWRKELHQIPETGINLPQTVAYVAKKLEEWDIPYKVYEESSNILAQIGSGQKCFLLRGDMDGLPISEESGETFASSNGCMHACGHDMHTAMLLGAAKMLKAHESELNGIVKLLFQSGEEIFAGAKAVIEAGVMENPQVNAAMAQHVFSQFPVKCIMYNPYPMASVYGFRITIKGKGSHGSMPEEGVDSINTGLHIHLALQELISREIAASDECVLTIGKFSAGSAANVIPDTAVLEGTLRTFKREIQEYMIKRIQEVVQGVAKTYRSTAEIEVLSDVPALVCDTKLTDMALEVIHELDDTLNTSPEFHALGSEDFACFSELVPVCHFCIGAGVENESERYPQHNPKIRFHMDALPIGTAIYAAAALRYLK